MKRISFLALSFLISTMGGVGGCGGSNPVTSKRPPALIAPTIIDGRAELPYRLIHKYSALGGDELLSYLAAQNNGFYTDEQRFREAAREGIKHVQDDKEYAASSANDLASQVNWGKEYLVLTAHYSPVTCNSSHIERVRKRFALSIANKIGTMDKEHSTVQPVSIWVMAVRLVDTSNRW